MPEEIGATPLRLLDAAFDVGVKFFDSAEMCASFFNHPMPLLETPQPLK
jgi:hypothetical protein